MGIAALVLGIVAIVFAFIPGVGIVGPIIGIVGIVLGALARKKDPEDGKAKAGLICSIIGTALALVFYIACVACVSAVGSAVGAGEIANAAASALG